MRPRAAPPRGGTTCRAGLYAPASSAERIASKRRSPWRARSTSSATCPLDSVAVTRSRRSSSRPSRTSGQGSSSCQPADEPRLRGVVDGRQAARGEQLVERRAVQLVERAGRALPSVGLLERRRVAPAPVVGELGRGRRRCRRRAKTLAMLERQSTSVPKTSKTSARIARAQANCRRCAGLAQTRPSRSLGSSCPRVVSGSPRLLVRHPLGGLALGCALGEVVRADLGVDLGRVAERRLVVADDVRLGEAALAAVPQGVMLVAAVAGHLTLPELAVAPGRTTTTMIATSDDGDRPGDPSGDGGGGRDDGEEGRGEQKEGSEAHTRCVTRGRRARRTPSV